MLCVAFKYNDIFYAISTDEWQIASYRVLLIFESSNLSKFPCTDKFDKIIRIRYSPTFLGILSSIIKIKNEFNHIDFDFITLSNPVLLVNLYVLSITKCNCFILLEDGLMNYYNFISNNSLKKRILKKVLDVNEISLRNKFTKTYLLFPEASLFYYGNKQKLILSKYLAKQSFFSIENKSIFVGQNLYDYGFVDIDKYNVIVNKIINKYNIDFYLPHPYHSSSEKIECPKLDIQESLLTLELLASLNNFTIYSFGSSVLYTTKCINPNVKSIFIDSLFYKNKENMRVIFEMSDKSISYENI